MAAMKPKMNKKKASVALVQAIQKPPKIGSVHHLDQVKTSSCGLPTLPQP